MIRKKTGFLAGLSLLLLLAGILVSQNRGTPSGRPPYSNRRPSYYRRTTPGGRSGVGSKKNLKQIWSKNFLKGFKISATFNRTDIRSVLRLFYEQTGLNFVITQNVRGQVTGRFNNVPALEALVTVLRVNNLYFIEEGSIIRVVPPDEYRQDIIAKNIETRIFNINHAQYKSLKAALDPILTEGVGKAALDEKSNQLMITDLKDNFEQIERVIKAFSQAARQVHIDIKVVQIKLTEGNQRGVNWNVMNVGNYFSFSSLFKLADQNTSGYGQIATAGISSGSMTVDGFLQFLSTFQNMSILTSPKIVASHGEKALIHIGDNIPYISKTTSNTTTGTSESTVAFLDAGIKFEVTPYIGSDNTIRLAFKVEISTASMETIYGTQKAPQKNITRAESTIKCDNKALVVIGGLFENKIEESENKVPLLGDIPLLKYLFSWKTKETTKREIAILISPRIIGSDSAVPVKKSVKNILEKETKSK